jgi:chemotaxis protein MotB
MVIFFKYILRIVFIGLTLFCFITSCSTHKLCNESGNSVKKYKSKRYRAALNERDSLCSVALGRKEELDKLSAKLEDLNQKYADLSRASGSELNKLNKDLGNKEAILSQKEMRLKQLEGILRRQDSLLQRLNNLVKSALVGFSPDELRVEMKGGKVYVSLSDKLLFKSGDATVEAKGKEALKKLAEVLNKNDEVSIAVEGHTDNVPISTSLYKDNWDLSAARAINVVRLLTNEYNMDAKRLTAAGKGEHFPIADNTSTEGKSRNRRTEIVLSPKLEELMKIIAGTK